MMGMGPKDFYDMILVEAVAQNFYKIQQEEARRQGSESQVDYYSLSEENKEYVRVLARFILERIDKMVDVLKFYATEENWTTLLEDKDNITLKDGAVFDDMGKRAREELFNLGVNKDKSGDKK